MKCTEIQELLSAYYDNELAPELRTQVDAHIGECVNCSTELAGFEKLSSLAASLDAPETPASVWSAVAQELDENNDSGQVEIAKQATNINRTPLLKYAAALAATLLIGFVGFQLLFHGDHDHKEMAEAMEYVAANSDADGITTHLLNKYGGGEISADNAITQVGYRPIASKGLPVGYTVESIQVLNMPCCKCTQTACRRPDNSRFFIFEHDNEETGWFEHRNKRQCNCGGKDCQVVELDNRLVATYEKDNRHVTLLGVRDEEEIELLVSQFEEKS